jgi:hypothetical protein
MQVNSHTTVELSSGPYLGGPIAPYLASTITIGRLRSISPIESAVEVDTFQGWGDEVATPFEVPSDPTETTFIINANRDDWVSGQPLPTAWSTRELRVCRVTFKSTASDPGYRLEFIAKPHKWSIQTSTSDVTVIQCSILVTSKVEPQLL